MPGHVGSNVPELAGAKEYCDEVMPLVGLGPPTTNSGALRKDGNHYVHLRPCLTRDDLF